MALYFARHGQTFFGKQKRLEGVSNSSLTKKGREQAEKLGLFLKDKKIKEIVSSPLGRARETAEMVQNVIGKELKVKNIWREMSYGGWDGKAKKELEKKVLWKEREKNKYSFLHPGNYKKIKGESYKILGKRLRKVFGEIKNDFPKNNIVIVSHLGILRSVKKYFENLSEDETVAFSPHNNHVLKLYKIRGNIKISVIEI